MPLGLEARNGLATPEVRSMCNLYSITRNQAAIRDNEGDERELTMMRWGGRGKLQQRRIAPNYPIPGLPHRSIKRFRLPVLCRFLGRRHDEVIHALRRPASEKRQGTKSREVGGGGAAGAMGIWPRGEAWGGWGAGVAAIVFAEEG